MIKPSILLTFWKFLYINRIIGTPYQAYEEDVMRMKQAALALFLTLAVTGCGKNSGAGAFSPAETSLYITGEGAVISADVEKYEKDYYKADELRAVVEEALLAFNGPDGAKSADGKQEVPFASLEQCSMENGTAKLLIKFKDAGEYLRFMEEYPDEESTVQVKNLDVVSVEDGVAKGYLIGENFVKADGKAVSAEEVTKKSKLTVAAVEGQALIQTDGDVLFVSGGVTMEGNMARTPKDGVSYIIFK